ncbi:hypothetical protein NDA13_002632 [Ustilago tritici]|nr:hypothetical protein NDA13_002632 [Ustilago tritici]
MAAAACKTCTNALASAPTTAATAAASASSRLTPPLPLTIFLTEDSPMFCGLQQQLNNQASALSDIATSLQQLLALLSNPKPWLPQPPSSQPVATTLASTTLPAANTAGSALGAPLPGESDVDRIFSWLLWEVVQQVINNTLPLQDLGRLCNPDLLLVNNKHEHAVLVNSVLIKSIPSAASTSSTHHFTKLIPNIRCFAEAWTIYTCIRACTTNNPNLSTGLGAFLLHIIQTNHTHTWLLPNQAAPTAKPTPSQVGHLQSARRASRCAFGTMVEAVPRATHAGGDTNVVVAPAATASRTAPDPIQVVTPRHSTGLDGLVSLTSLSPAAPDFEPAQRPPPPQGSARHINGPAGLPDLSTPPLQGLARLVGNSASTLDLGTPLLQGSARSVVMPAGLGGTRTPPLLGLARLFNLVLAALNVPSADQCLSLLLNAWSHNPGPCPNTSFAGNVFDPASQPARHGSMQEHAFAWSTLLSLYPDPIYHCQLLGMTKHSCLLGYNGLLCNADCCSDNLPVSLTSHSHLHKEIDACLAEGHLSIILASTNLIESPIGVVPKPRSTKLHTIHHLSHPCQPTAAALPSVNAGISPGFIRLRYKGLQDLLAFVSQNPGCLLWKGNLEDTFQHIVTAKRNVHLLGFSYDSICYHKNALTFGGSSSPWLFNLVAKFLHWLVAACLPANWPINQYLDNTFGAIPVLHATHTLLPVHILSLAANALGLWLSPKKTFGASTKLKPSAAPFHGPAQHAVDCRPTTVCVSGLPMWKSLQCLYNTTCHTLPGKHCLTQPAHSELIWWCDVLKRWSGTSILSPLPLTAAHIWTDACPKGYGGYLGLDTSPTAVFAKTVPRCHCKKNIRFLEALAVLAALQRFLPHWSGPTLVVVHVNNENIEHGLCSGCSHNLLTQRLLQEIFGLCLKHNLTIQLQQVSSTDNVLADLLSCQHFLRIQLLFPCVHNALFSHLAHTVALQVPHLASLPVLVSLLVPPTSCGTALLPAPAAMLGARPCPSSPSASNILGLAPPVFRPQASNCWSGLPTSPALVALSTWPSMGLVPFNPTTWILASTPQVLLAMGKMADLFPQDCLVLQAAFALAFACFLHSGKLVWDCSTDRTTILTVSSVEWASDHVVLTLPTSKTDPFQQGVHVVAPEVGGIECPVARLRHLSHSHPPLALLFGLGPSGLNPLPQSTFVTILCRAIQACSLLALQYTSHSFHRGAATWALQHGASTTNIQSLSQWSSNCYYRYIDRSAQERHALVASALFSVCNGPLVPSGPAWRDPGLA